jgi:hypothetical protein
MEEETFDKPKPRTLRLAIAGLACFALAILPVASTLLYRACGFAPQDIMGMMWTCSTVFVGIGLIGLVAAVLGAFDPLV